MSDTLTVPRIITTRHSTTMRYGLRMENPDIEPLPLCAGRWLVACVALVPGGLCIYPFAVGQPGVTANDHLVALLQTRKNLKAIRSLQASLDGHKMNDAI